MNELKDKKWDVFFLDELFEIKSSLHQIDRINVKNNGDKEYPYVTRSNVSNGISDFISYQDIEPNAGNVITIGLDTQTVFYQKSEFYTGQNIQILERENLNRNIALFLIPLLEKQMKKFNWGGNGATLTRLKRLSIYLPINQEANPDWRFMEEYTKEQIRVVTEKVKFPEINEATDQRGLNDLVWKQFKMRYVFTIESGVRLTKADMTPGTIPFIGATDNNNGITGYTSTVNKSLDSNVLGVNYNGSVVENFYHPYTAVFSDDVKRLKLKKYPNNRYVLLFMKTIILQQKEKYAYGYKFNATRMKEQIILLPTKDDGTPDYEFMEQYMKRQENKVISRIKQEEAGR